MIRTSSTEHDMPQVLVPLIIVRFMRIVFVPLLLDGMLLIGSVIAMPLGDDEDDFPAGSFIESLEDECLAPGSAIEQYHPAYSKVTNLTRRKVDDQGREQKD